MNSNKRCRIIKHYGISVLRLIVLFAFSFIIVYPVIFMISNSVKVQADTLNPAVNLFSRTPTLYSFKAAFVALDFFPSLGNTVIFEIISAVIEVFACAFYAYGLSRFEFPLKKVLMFFLIVIILVPDIMLIIPRLLNFRHMDFLGILGLIGKLTGTELRPDITDTVLPFYLPSIFGVGLKSGIFIFIYMQFFKGLPIELEEAASIDGATSLRTFLSIIIPSSGVVFLTVFIFSFIWHWNDTLFATMYTTNNHTLATILSNIGSYITFATVQQKIVSDPNLLYGAPLAACIIFIAIPLVLYLILQRKFIQSIDRVGIVG